MSSINLFHAILERFNITHSDQRIALLKFMLSQRGAPFSLAELKNELNGTLNEDQTLADIQLFEQHQLIRKFYEDPYAHDHLKDVSTYFICD